METEGKGPQTVPPTIPRTRTSRSVSSCSRKKLPGRLGLIILFSSPLLAKGAKEADSSLGGATQLLSTPPPPSACRRRGAWAGGWRLVKHRLSPCFSLTVALWGFLCTWKAWGLQPARIGDTGAAPMACCAWRSLERSHFSCLHPSWPLTPSVLSDFEQSQGLGGPPWSNMGS